MNLLVYYSVYQYSLAYCRGWQHEGKDEREEVRDGGKRRKEERKGGKDFESVCILPSALYFIKLHFPSSFALGVGLANGKL